MGTTFSRAAADQTDARTLQEREVIGNLILTDIEAEHQDADQPMPMQPRDNRVVEEPSEVPCPTTPDRHAGVEPADAQNHSVVLDEAAKRAFMYYQRSAAEAAVHQSSAEPAVKQVEHLEEAAHKRQKMDGKATGVGNSHRSRKRQMRQAASQAASKESTPSKRRKRESEMLFEYTLAISSEGSGLPGSHRKRQTPMQEADTPAKKARTPRQKPADWVYVGPNLKMADVPQGDWMTCPVGRSYPRSMTYKEGDLLLEDYLDKTDNDQLYVVEAIIDERRRGKKRQFRVKWEGFELNPEEWIPYSNVKDIAELDNWEAKLRDVP